MTYGSFIGYSKVPHNCNTPKKPIEPLKPLNFGGKLHKNTNQNLQDCQSACREGLVIRTSSAFSAREETESSTATSNERKNEKAHIWCTAIEGFEITQGRSQIELCAALCDF